MLWEFRTTGESLVRSGFQVFDLTKFENRFSCHTLSKSNVLDIRHLIYKVRMLN